MSLIEMFDIFSYFTTYLGGWVVNWMFVLTENMTQ